MPDCGHDIARPETVIYQRLGIDADFVGDSVRLVTGGGGLEECRKWNKAHARLFARCKEEGIDPSFSCSTILHRVSEFATDFLGLCYLLPPTYDT